MYIVSGSNVLLYKHSILCKENLYPAESPPSTWRHLFRIISIGWSKKATSFNNTHAHTYPRLCPNGSCDWDGWCTSLSCLHSQFQCIKWMSNNHSSYTWNVQAKWVKMMWTNEPWYNPSHSRFLSPYLPPAAPAKVDLSNEGAMVGGYDVLDNYQSRIALNDCLHFVVGVSEVRVEEEASSFSGRVSTINPWDRPCCRTIFGDLCVTSMALCMWKKW